MKDRTTHLAYKTEHVVHLETRGDPPGRDPSRDQERQRHAGEESANGPVLPEEAATYWYIKEVAADKSKATQTKVRGTFGAVERHIGPKYLRAVDAGQISRFSAKLRELGNAEASIASTPRTLKAALRWAARLKLIPEAPHITMPPKAGEKAGGRAVTEEEFERMLAVVPKVLETKGRVADAARRRKTPHVVTPAMVESWRFLLRGLW